MSVLSVWITAETAREEGGEQDSLVKEKELLAGSQL